MTPEVIKAIGEYIVIPICLAIGLTLLHREVFRGKH